MGTAVVFHPAQSLDALPHGECDDGSSVEASQASLKTAWLRSSMISTGRGELRRAVDYRR